MGGFVVVLGISAILFGVITGNDPASYSVVVEETVSEDSLSDDHEVIEYDYLKPHVQDGFREALRTGDTVDIPGPPGEFRGGYVHYRDSYYFSYIEIGDASTRTLFFSIGSGIVLVLIGGTILLITRRRREKHQGK